MRLRAIDVSWLLQNEGNCGCGNGGAGVCRQIVQDWWRLFASGIALRQVHWQKGLRCVGIRGSYLTARNPPWEQNGSPPIVNIMQISHSYIPDKYLPSCI